MSDKLKRLLQKFVAFFVVVVLQHFDFESTDINREAVAEGSQAQARSAAAPGSNANLIEALKGRH